MNKLNGPTPILVSSIGRSGSTLLMSKFGKSQEVFFPRYYPFERRYLSYFAHLADVMSQTELPEGWSYRNLFQGSLKMIGPMPFLDDDVLNSASVTNKNIGVKFLQDSINSFMSVLHPEYFSAKYWVEKGTEQAGLLDYLGITERIVLYLVRDPRDMLLSHMSFATEDFRYDDIEYLIAEYKSWLDGYLLYGVSDKRTILVKYEDLVLQEEMVLEMLSTKLNLNLTGPDLPIPGKHVTSKSIAESIGRWKREPDKKLIAKIENVFKESMEYFGYLDASKMVWLKYESVSDLSFGLQSENQVAIVGKAGFMFISRGTNDWQNFCARSFSIDTGLVKDWLEEINSRQCNLEQRGIKYKFIISPEKDIIYNDFSPHGNHISANRAAVLLQNNCEYVVYPESHLRNVRNTKGDTYRKQDSHWNLLGGYEFYNCLMGSIGYEAIPFEELATKEAICVNDLLLHYGIDQPTTETVLALDAINEDILVKVEAPRFTGMRLKLTNDAAKYPETVLVFGDSYSWNYDAGLIRFLALSFKTVHFIWSQKMNYELVDELSPNIVISEIAERFLIANPNDK